MKRQTQSSQEDVECLYEMTVGARIQHVQVAVAETAVAGVAAAVALKFDVHAANLFVVSSENDHTNQRQLEAEWVGE